MPFAGMVLFLKFSCISLFGWICFMEDVAPIFCFECFWQENRKIVVGSTWQKEKVSLYEKSLSKERTEHSWLIYVFNTLGL